MRTADRRPPFAGLGDARPEKLFGALPTPCYILDEAVLKRNGEILAGLAARTGCKILLAQKAFSNFDLYPVLSPYLAGTEASGLYEARLGFEEMPDKEVHVFCTAYRADELDRILSYADHLVFNSVSQLKRFGATAKQAGKQVGLRVNPECSTQVGHAVYDPCAAGSRLGVTRETWEREMTPELVAMLDGLHFHTLCEQDADALEATLNAVEARFGEFLPAMRWLNMGGGHHITRPDYDLARLERCIRRAQDAWALQVILEPGEACALNAGYLATRVLDLVQNGETQIAILDASAACHMPDVLEMPYLPPLYGAGAPENAPHVYRLGGPTCLAGDWIGEYGFDAPLKVGDLLLFGDMAIYTTCKTNTFNGMPLPALVVRRADGSLETLATYAYADFKGRLGAAR